MCKPRIVADLESSTNNGRARSPSFGILLVSLRFQAIVGRITADGKLELSNIDALFRRSCEAVTYPLPRLTARGKPLN